MTANIAFFCADSQIAGTSEIKRHPAQYRARGQQIRAARIGILKFERSIQQIPGLRRNKARTFGNCGPEI